MKTQHRKILLKHLKELIIKANSADANLDELIEITKGILVSMAALKKSYK